MRASKGSLPVLLLPVLALALGCGSSGREPAAFPADKGPVGDRVEAPAILPLLDEPMGVQVGTLEPGVALPVRSRMADEGGQIWLQVETGREPALGWVPEDRVRRLEGSSGRIATH